MYCLFLLYFQNLSAFHAFYLSKHSFVWLNEMITCASSGMDDDGTFFKTPLLLWIFQILDGALFPYLMTIPSLPFPRHLLHTSHQSSSSRVLIHCVKGQSRSPSVLIAYLMYRLKMPLREAFQYLKVHHSLLGALIADCANNSPMNEHRTYGHRFNRGINFFMN